jgi:hypothetical protein
MRLQQVLQACWRNPVFGDSYPSPIALTAVEQRMETLAHAFAAAFTPLVLRALPDVPLTTRTTFIREATLRVIGLCSVIGLEIHDVERLTAASICYGLMSLGDSFLDRGDAAMEVAIHLLLEEHGIAPPQLDSSTEPMAGSERYREREVTGTSLPAVSSAPVQARLNALRQLDAQIAYLSRPEDAPVLILTPCLSFFKHSLALRQVSRRLRHAGQGFWEEFADSYVEHSIRNIQVFGEVGIIYALYRQVDPSLPSLVMIQRDTELMRLMDHTANAALRIFDDVGDQEVDAGATPWSQPTFNLFHHPAPALIRAFLRFADITDEQRIEQAIRAIQSSTREGDAAIVQLFVELIRKRLAQLPEASRRRHSTFLLLLKRIIESGYVNAVGDQALAVGV